ncbi:MAG: Do family serine endopeptidase [Holophaga sp.]|nr:Do family serine endopeptidase [Holophaga sp.]
MGLSYRWVAQAQEEMPVMAAGKGLEGMPPIADVAEKLNPTVVSIVNTSFVKNRSRGENDSPFGDDFYNWFFGPQRPSPRRPQDEEQRIQAGGSGVIISPDGEILTNYHVIEALKGGQSSIEVKISSGRTFKARVLGRDKELDIALIKIEAKHLPYAKLGNSEAMRVGEWVVAIGNPLGLDHTVTQGIISAKGRQISGPGLESFLQTDAAINRGNSGGPLLNLRGEVIGINTAIRPDGQNIGFAVPVDMITRVLPDLRSGRAVSRGYLGVATKDLDNEFQDSLGIQEGAVVSEVVRGGPGDKAGIKRLDVITGVDGSQISTGEDLVGAISSRRAGDTVKVTVFREGKTMALKATLGDREKMMKGQQDEDSDQEETPRNAPQNGKALNLEKTYGFSVEGLSPANRHQYGISADWRGVVVTSVASRSVAQDKGLRAGFVISAVGTRDIDGLQDFYQEVKKAGGKRPILILVRTPRSDARATLAIPPR